MLENIKLALRISGNSLDDDIQRNIYACLEDLKRVGADPDNVQNSFLIEKACELYLKWQYDFGGKGDGFYNHYVKLRDALSISEGYKNGRL